MWPRRRRRRSSSENKDYTYSSVRRYLNTLIHEVKVDLSAQLVAGMDGLPLYTHLFGDISPVKVTIETTPELARFTLLTVPMVIDEKPYRDLVGVSVTRADYYNITVPVSAAGRVYWLGLKSSAPVHRLGFNFCRIGSSPGFYTQEEGEPTGGASLVSHCRNALADVYGIDYLERVDRVITINDRLTNLDARVEDYARTGVHSPGALFKHLPALNSLCPNLYVKHVTITRLAKPPDPQLVEDLNLLANLAAVTKKGE